MTGRQLELFDPIRHATKPRRAKKPAPRKRPTNPWAGLSDEERLARINAIRVKRGLPPKESL